MSSFLHMGKTALGWDDHDEVSEADIKAEIRRLKDCEKGLVSAIEAARPLLVALFDRYTVMRDQLRRGETPKPSEFFNGDDERPLAVIEELTVILRQYYHDYPVMPTLCLPR